MKKYIRTTDNKIIDTTKENYIVNGNDLILHQQYETCSGPEIKPGQMFVPSIAIIQKHNEYIFVGEIEKQADTIEELCDEFVAIYKDENKSERVLETFGDYRQLDEEQLIYNIKNGWRIYGAIWTDKGLIYVAKMNDKGELELI